MGLAYIAGALEAAGFRTIVIDGVGEAIHQYNRLPGYKRALLHGLSVSQIIERIPYHTEVIGVSCMFSMEWSFVRFLLEEIRKRFPAALIITGGEHITACAEYVLQVCAAIDICVLGEGEETIADLLNAYFDGRPLETVPGICFRLRGNPFRTAIRKRIKDVDFIPEPCWDMFPLEEYISNRITSGAYLGRSMPILASRGCPYDCTFCSSPEMWTRKWSARNPQMLLDEMKKYIRRYQITNFDFYDLTAIVRKDWIVEFCRLILKQKLRITWQLPSGTRSEAIDSEVTALLYASGCRLMNYAPESGSVPELKRIKKKVNLDKMAASIQAARKNGIEIKCNFIFGMPGATWGDVLRTYGFVTRLAKVGVEEISAFSYTAYPGSEMFSNLLKEGKIKLNEDYFRSLLAYTEISKSVSYNSNFPVWSLPILNLITMTYFFCLNFLIRPQRLVRLISLVMTGKTSTKLATAMWHLSRKIKAWRLCKKESRETVILSH